MADTKHLSNDQYVIAKTLSVEDNYIESDGETYWLVDEAGYKEISKDMVNNFLERKIIHPQKISDDTTLFYITKEAKVNLMYDQIKYNR